MIDCCHPTRPFRPNCFVNCITETVSISSNAQLSLILFVFHSSKLSITTSRSPLFAQSVYSQVSWVSWHGVCLVFSEKWSINTRLGYVCSQTLLAAVFLIRWEKGWPLCVCVTSITTIYILYGHYSINIPDLMQAWKANSQVFILKHRLNFLWQ